MWQSRTGDVEVTLQTGPVVTENANFQIYVNFLSCPTVGYVAGAFGEVSQTVYCLQAILQLFFNDKKKKKNEDI